jgi:hypothetical protein
MKRGTWVTTTLFLVGLQTSLGWTRTWTPNLMNHFSNSQRVLLATLVGIGNAPGHFDGWSGPAVQGCEIHATHFFKGESINHDFDVTFHIEPRKPGVDNSILGLNQSFYARGQTYLLFLSQPRLSFHDYSLLVDAAFLVPHPGSPAFNNWNTFCQTTSVAPPPPAIGRLPL